MELPIFFLEYSEKNWNTVFQKIIEYSIKKCNVPWKNWKLHIIMEPSVLPIFYETYGYFFGWKYYWFYLKKINKKNSLALIGIFEYIKDNLNFFAIL